MLFPERNCGVIISCCFETYLAHAVSCESALDLCKKSRADTRAAESFEHVNGDDVAARALPGREAEAGHFVFDFRDNALGSRKPQVIPQLPTRICHGGFIARLVNLVQRLEIFWPVTAKF